MYSAVQEKLKKCDNVYKQADLKLKSKINGVENNIKDDKYTAANLSEALKAFELRQHLTAAVTF